MVKVIRKMARNRKWVLGVRSLYEGRKLKPFDGRSGVMTRIKDELVPQLESVNLACLVGDKIYIHPAIIEKSWNPNFKVYEGDHASRLPYHLRYIEEEVEVAMEFYRKAKTFLTGK